MTSKQIAYLKSQAMKIKPVLQVGKLGIHDNVITDIEQYLDAHELMKVSLLPNSDIDLTDFKALLASKNITTVSKIGRTLILYRFSKKLKEHVLEV